MRLWHQSLIPYLDRQRLLGQHRECAALRGAGWGRKHATVDYVFTHDPAYLVAYHCLVMNEMNYRGYHPDEIWYNVQYRGKTIGMSDNWVNEDIFVKIYDNSIIFPEHNNIYLQECLNILKSKGVEINL